MAQAAKVALLAEFDGEDLTGYFLIGDFGIFHAGFHVFDGCAGFDLVIGIVGGGEDNLVVVVGVECDFFPRLFHGEREDSGVGAADDLNGLDVRTRKCGLCTSNQCSFGSLAKAERVTQRRNRAESGLHITHRG
jgi:hypothetical protein